MQREAKYPQTARKLTPLPDTPTLLTLEIRAANEYYCTNRHKLLRQILPQQRTVEVTV